MKLDSILCYRASTSSPYASILGFGCGSSALMSSAYEPLESVSSRTLSKMTLFLLALATAKRVGELQAVSNCVAYVADDAMMSYLPHFVAKT